MRPESERLKEDLEFAEKTRKAKPKGKQVFLQKFHHKGAFYTVCT
jgi:microfibrillar-associated protein 1